ncbi:MAG: hypothetical protein ACI84C_001938 [Flavobacteriales bacterium]|jgi:hypothetical protein
MKKNQLILLPILLLIIQQVSYGQEFSEQVTDYIAVQDSIVALKNVTKIDGTGGETKYNQGIALNVVRRCSDGCPIAFSWPY